MISFLAFVIVLLFVFLVEPIVYTLQFYFWLVKKDSPRSKPTIRLSRAWIIAAIIISLPFAVLSFSGLASQYEQQRIEQTEKTASELADRFFAQLEADPDAALKPGPLEQTDAWDQKLRLTVQRSVFGHGVEVYSDGPDGKPGTQDDLMVSRFHPADPEEFRGSLALKGKVAIEDWIAGKKDLLVPDKDGDEVKIEQEFKGAKISIKFGSGNQKEQRSFCAHCKSASVTIRSLTKIQPYSFAHQSAMLINAYCTHRNPPSLEFPHELIGSRDLSDPELVDHLNGFIDFIMQGGEREMTQTLYHVYRHIERAQNHLSLEVEEAHLDAFAAWAWEANAILFLPDGSVCDPNGNILVSPEDGSSEPEARVPYPDDALDRREAISKDLHDLKLEPYEGLPPVIGENEVDLRSAKEVARRAIALMAVAIRAEGLGSGQPIPVEEIRERLPQAFEVLTPVEQEFMNNDSPDQQSIINHAWRYECLFVLQWALGHFDELHFPSAICDVPEVVGDILNRDRDEMIANAKLRPTSEILDEVDLHFRLHWIARQASQDGKPAPAGLDMGVIQERRVALNWLIRFENAEWDDVECPT